MTKRKQSSRSSTSRSSAAARNKGKKKARVVKDPDSDYRLDDFVVRSTADGEEEEEESEYSDDDDDDEEKQGEHNRDNTNSSSDAHSVLYSTQHGAVFFAPEPSSSSRSRFSRGGASQQQQDDRGEDDDNSGADDEDIFEEEKAGAVLHGLTVRMDPDQLDAPLLFDTVPSELFFDSCWKSPAAGVSMAEAPSAPFVGFMQTEREEWHKNSWYKKFIHEVIHTAAYCGSATHHPFSHWLYRLATQGRLDVVPLDPEHTAQIQSHHTCEVCRIPRRPASSQVVIYNTNGTILKRLASGCFCADKLIGVVDLYSHLNILHHLPRTVWHRAERLVTLQVSEILRSITAYNEGKHRASASVPFRTHGRFAKMGREYDAATGSRTL